MSTRFSFPSSTSPDLLFLLVHSRTPRYRLPSQVHPRRTRSQSHRRLQASSRESSNSDQTIQRASTSWTSSNLSSSQRFRSTGSKALWSFDRSRSRWRRRKRNLAHRESRVASLPPCPSSKLTLCFFLRSSETGLPSSDGERRYPHRYRWRLLDWSVRWWIVCEGRELAGDDGSSKAVLRSNGFRLEVSRSVLVSLDF